MSDQTIFAVASGRARSGVAVVRISGPGSRAAVEVLSGSLPAPRRAVLRNLVSRETSEPIDQALVLWFPGPQSFTGEDVAEFHVHGSPAVLAALLAALGRLDGFRPAEAGEFTRRAFHHGKLDLTQVEGLADLIEAETEAQRRQAFRQMDGAMGEAYEAHRAGLVRSLAYVEAEIDFPDESDVPEDVAAAARSALEDVRASVAAMLDDGRRGERLRDGLVVVIVGRPNVGKSSLLNALARRDAAIVSESAGTTRDVIEVHMDLAGYPVVLVDTAGLRETEDLVEREGVQRARARMEKADLVLWVTDYNDAALGPPSDIEGSQSVVVAVNKTDLPGTGCEAFPSLPDGSGVEWISAKTGEGLSGLVERISSIAAGVFEVGGDALVTRERHRLALEDCLAHVDAAVAGWGGEAELVAEDLRMAARALGRVTGRVDVEDLLDVIFSDFCIGK